MSDTRIPFEDALKGFQKFLIKEGWSDELLWLTHNRITGHRNQFWILEPDRLQNKQSTELFYKSILYTKSNIRIDAFCKLGNKTVAYVEALEGESQLLNYGIRTSELEVFIVKKRFLHIMIHLWNRLRGISPMLENIKIPSK